MSCNEAEGARRQMQKREEDKRMGGGEEEDSELMFSSQKFWCSLYKFQKDRAL